jgi:ankyrin repeat protein
MDYDGRTPLGVAASQGNVEAVQYLLAHGANFTMKDIRCGSFPQRTYHSADVYCSGNTPFDDAKREKRDAVIKIFGERQLSLQLGLIIK